MRLSIAKFPTINSSLTLLPKFGFVTIQVMDIRKSHNMIRQLMILTASIFVQIVLNVRDYRYNS